MAAQMDGTSDPKMMDEDELLVVSEVSTLEQITDCKFRTYTLAPHVFLLW